MHYLNFHLALKSLDIKMQISSNFLNTNLNAKNDDQKMKTTKKR